MRDPASVFRVSPNPRFAPTTARGLALSNACQSRISFIQDDARIQEIKARVASERAAVVELNTKLSDSYIKKNMIRQATNRLDDAETYLRHALKPTTQRDFEMWIAAAELDLQIAAQHRKGLEEIVAKYELNAQSMPPS